MASRNTLTSALPYTCYVSGTVTGDSSTPTLSQLSGVSPSDTGCVNPLLPIRILRYLPLKLKLMLLQRQTTDSTFFCWATSPEDKQWRHLSTYRMTHRMSPGT